MRGVSAKSLSTVLERTAQLIANEHDLEPLARELFTSAAIIDSSNQLVRVLSDTGRDAELKTQLVDRLFDGKAHGIVVDIIRTVAGLHWSEQNHILDAIEFAGVSIILAIAARQSLANETGEELFQFARLVESTPALSEAFAAKRESPQERTELVSKLLEGRAGRNTLLLARQAAGFKCEEKVVRRLDSFAEFASLMQNRKAGIVVSAVPLTEEQQSRLAATLSKRYGSELALNYEVDPTVVGGMQITVGDDLYDASISGRMRAAQELLTA